MRIGQDISSRNNRLAAIAAERGLKFKGFHKDLRALVKEYNPWSVYIDYVNECKYFGYEEIESYSEYLDMCFDNRFGGMRILPAAYRIIRIGESGDMFDDIRIEVYEVENSTEIPDWKLEYYGTIADTHEAPELELHILDKYDHEIIVPQDTLECFFNVRPGEYLTQLKKHMRSLAVAQHHTPILVDAEGADKLKAEVENLQGELSKGLKERHARWKVAYDALNELGIQI